jgi:hypothetical protein
MEKGNALGFRVETQQGTVEGEIPFGSVKAVPLDAQTTAKITLSPAKDLDIGSGHGHRLETTAEGGVVGLIFDCRGRPIQIPEDQSLRREKLLEWFQALNAYPEVVYEHLKPGETKEAS